MKNNLSADQCELEVPPQLAGLRLDQCLVRLMPDVSRSRFQNLIKEDHVLVNSAPCSSPKYTVISGDKIQVSAINAALPPTEFKGENIPLDILYEDPVMLVINKAPGMVVHPAAGNWNGTLVNALLGREPAIADDFAECDPSRPGIVHRLDKDTSGTLVVAKTPDALMKLSAAFAERKTAKTYIALVWGHFTELSGEIRNQIGRHHADRKKMAVVSKGGRDAHSAYEVVEQGMIGTTPAALVKVRIFTGRTHQIRVHMASIGHPVAGDLLYSGSRKIPAPRQMLHAWQLTLPHPDSGKIMSFESPFPPDLSEMIALLKQ
ncbi:MAG: RluA family pseudouridine synthase [Lentisphaeria bacterium]|nr:RluA family pseudouridine synthase [Lentisphaeria bacterium]